MCYDAQQCSCVTSGVECSSESIPSGLHFTICVHSELSMYLIQRGKVLSGYRYIYILVVASRTRRESSIRIYSTRESSEPTGESNLQRGDTYHLPRVRYIRVRIQNHLALVSSPGSHRELLGRLPLRTILLRT